MPDEVEATITQPPVAVNTENDGENLTEGMRKRINKIYEERVNPVVEANIKLQQQVTELQEQLNKLTESEKPKNEETQKETIKDETKDSSTTSSSGLSDNDVRVLQLEIALDNDISKDESVLLTARTREELEKQVQQIKAIRNSQARRSGVPPAGDKTAGRIYTRTDLRNMTWDEKVANAAEINRQADAGLIKNE